MDGQDLLQMPGREIAMRRAFVSAHVPGTQMTSYVVSCRAKALYALGLYGGGPSLVHEAMEQLGLTPLRGRFLSQLSGGERQKAILARALAQQPKILLLDEPTSSLDLQNQYQVLEIVRDICHTTGITAIVVIHDLNLALRFCDRFCWLRDGQIYRYGDASILDRTAILDVYGVHAELVSIKEHRMILVD
jgi:iron complex transport system ATP-binding protein